MSWKRASLVLFALLVLIAIGSFVLGSGDTSVGR